MPPTGKPGAGRAALAIAPDEPAPYTVLKPAAEVPLVLVCDHASRRLPRSLGDLGLDPLTLRGHLAVDVGAGALARHLSEGLGATAVLAGYSRLAVDCNRDLLDPGAFLEYGDGVVIPGNRNLSPEEKAARAEALYHPYHRAVGEQIARLRANALAPAIVSVHSFTPVLDGVSRPWEMGILWDADRPFAEFMVRELRRAGYVVGDNEPYSGKAPQDFTIDHHAEAAGLRHVGLEVRQDLIDGDEGAARIAAVLWNILAGALDALVGAGEAGHARGGRSAGQDAKREERDP